MAVVYITEYMGMGKDLSGNVIQTGIEPVADLGGTNRTLTISGLQLTSLTLGTKFVRLNGDGVFSFKFGTTSTAAAATTTNARMAANSTEFFAINSSVCYIGVILNT